MAGDESGAWLPLAAASRALDVTVDALRKSLRRHFGSRYSESLLLEAFGHQLARAPLTIVTRAHAPLDILIPQLRGLARTLGRGRVRILPVRGH